MIFVSSLTQRNDLAGDSFASESILDIDTNIVLFLMAYRCSNTERPGKRSMAMSLNLNLSSLLNDPSRN